MTPNTDWWIRLARTSPAGAAWLYLRELFESDHTHGFDDFMEDDGFMRLRAPGYSEIQVTSGGERMWPRWKAYLFASDGRRRAIDGPRDVGLMPNRAAELFFRDITASMNPARSVHTNGGQGVTEEKRDSAPAGTHGSDTKELKKESRKC